MKNILKTGITFLLFTPLFLSCETVEDVVLPRNEKSAVEVSTTSVTVMEGATSTITVTTTKAISKPMQFKLYQTGGTAVAGVDYDFSENSAADYGPIGGRIVIPAHATSGSVDIMGLTDFGIDGGTATFELRAMEAMNGVVGSSKEVSVTITDFTEDDLSIDLSWATSDEDNYHAADQDLDFLLVDARGGYVTGAFTGGMPEHMVLSASLPDGTYYVDLDYWAPSDFSFPGDPSLFTVEHILSIGKVGVFSTTVQNHVTDADAVTSEYLQWSGYAAFGGDGYIAGVAQIDKVGTTYTIKDMNGATVASGKFGTKKSPRHQYDNGLTIN
jgi:hypothetical protein